MLLTQPQGPPGTPEELRLDGDGAQAGSMGPEPKMHHHPKALRATGWGC